MKAKFLTHSLLLLALPAAAANNSVPEPQTVFYGRILERSGPVDRILTEGTLAWSLRKADGSVLPLSATLFPFKNGEFSYALRVPHEVLALGLTVSPSSVALGTLPTRQSHLQITVDGHQATIIAPGESVFDVQQALRAMTYRLDLEVGIPATDSDGDGIPDWWEDAHHLDKQLASDATGDPDGDGRNNRAEYLGGTDPNADSRVPELLTKEIVAYAGSISAVLLETADTDSTPAQLTYTLTVAPAAGQLRLRNVRPTPENPDRVLSTGDAFTQDDVARGRLNYQYAVPNGPLSFSVRVADENPAHAASSGTVQVLLYNPAPDAVAAGPAESLRRAAFADACQVEGCVVADLAVQSGTHRLAAPSGVLTPALYTAIYVPSFGSDRRHFLLGGARQDFLTGSMADDTICGSGGDDQLTGAGGADRFVYNSAADGNDTITDFLPADHDVIDLTAVLAGPSRLLTDYVRITRSGADAMLGIDADGSGTGYSDMVLRLKNSPLTQADLRTLYEAGNLLTGSIGLSPQVTVLAAVSRTSENGPPWGQFNVLRSGSTSEPLTVAIQISGSATNGIDYELVQPVALIPAGSQSVSISIRPYEDGFNELDEVVQLAVSAAPGYETGVPSAAQIVIEDLKPQIFVETLNSLAAVNDLSPAAFLIGRRGATDRGVVVRLNIGGNATNGTDYNRIDNYLSLAPFQTSGVIQILPKPDAVLNKGAESVILSVKPDTSYLTGAPSMASVVIVPQTIDLDRWRQTQFPGDTQSASLFAISDPGSHGLPNLLRYGFGLNPQNPREGAADLLPRAEIMSGHLALRFNRRPAARDLEYRVEMSDDMKTWREAGPEVPDLSMTQVPGDPTAALYRVVQPASESPIRFLRVRIVRIQP